MSGSETYKFTGKPYSAATGLYYDYQRWYDPSIGRFISQDSDPGGLENPQTLNGYIYAVNDPTRLVDPNGASPVDAVNLLFKGDLSISNGATRIPLPRTLFTDRG